MASPSHPERLSPCLSLCVVPGFPFPVAGSRQRDWEASKGGEPERWLGHSIRLCGPDVGGVPKVQ